MPEEVEDRKVSQSEDIISKIKATSTFGPFEKCEQSKAKQWVQWQCFKVCNINFHYEIIAGASAAANEGEKKDTSKIYAEFHIEPQPDVSEEIINAFKEGIVDVAAASDEIQTFSEWQSRGFAIRYGDGIEITDEEIIKQLADQMTDLYKKMDDIVYSFIIKYTFKGLFDSSDTSAEKFSIDFNKRICDFYNKNDMKMSSYLLVKILNGIFSEDLELVSCWSSTRRIRDFTCRILPKEDNQPDGQYKIKIHKLINILSRYEILISPFTFWSFFFACDGPPEKKNRLEILKKLIEKINHLGDNQDNANFCQLKTKLADKLKTFRNSAMKSINKDNLTIEGWMQNVADLSYAPTPQRSYVKTCWDLFEKLMDSALVHKSNFEEINPMIQNLIDPKNNNGIGAASIQNILPFIRPDLKFDFDNDGNITGFTKTEEMNMEETIKLLEGSKQIILTGAPGTGKTYLATQVAEKMIKDARTSEEIAKITEKAKQTEEYKKAGTNEKKAKIIEKYKEKLTEEEKKLFQKVQFHPGYDYSDFITGLKPKVVEGGQVTFDWENGVFKEFADKALEAYKQAKKTAKEQKEQAEKTKDEEIKAKPYIFIIDEINRADLSRVFGEVFSLLEEDYRYPNKEKGITLPCKANFILPPNLYIIGTMNDIDRSVESMDFALRRRFSWKEVTAESSVSIIYAKDKNDNPKIANENHRFALQRAMKELNKYISGKELPIDEKQEQKVSLNLGTEYQLGGAYFLNFTKYQKENNPFESLWNNHIAIILNEYLRGRSNREQILSALKAEYDKAWKGNGSNNDGEKDKKKNDTGNATADSTPEQPKAKEANQ